MENYEQKEKSSEDLEAAAKHYLLQEHISPLNDILHQADLKVEMQYHKDIENAFKAGAHCQHGKDFDDLLQSEMKFPKEYYEKGKADMREEMMKDAVEGQIYREYIGDDGISIAFGLEAYLNEHNPKHNKLHDGDKVKIVIVKEEQQ